MKQPQLIEMQLILLEILKDFHNFYVRHHLKYMLFAGSLLGAIRHEGFIPWGDDIDVAMPHQDFESFLKHWDNDDSHLFL